MLSHLHFALPRGRRCGVVPTGGCSSAGPGRGLAVCGPRSFKVTGVRFAAIENLAGIGGGGSAARMGKVVSMGSSWCVRSRRKKGLARWIQYFPFLSFPPPSPPPFPFPFPFHFSSCDLFVRIDFIVISVRGFALEGLREQEVR